MKVSWRTKHYGKYECKQSHLRGGDVLIDCKCWIVCFYNRNLLGGLYRENPVKSRNYEAVKSSKKWENVGNSYIIPALLLYRYSYI